MSQKNSLPDPPTLAFFERIQGNHEINKGFFSAEPLKSLENKGKKRTEKERKISEKEKSRIVMQIGGGYTTVCQEEGILLQRYRDRNGRCIAILFKSIGVRGRFDSPNS